MQTLSALRMTICCQCCRFAEQIQESLCDIFQSVHTSPVAACRNAWGGKNSLHSNIMPPVSAHCSATRCASQRCPFAFGDELPFAMGCTMVISKKNRHRKQHSVNPCRMQAIVRGTSKRSTAIIFLQICRTQCDPQHPADGRMDWNGKRGTDE